MGKRIPYFRINSAAASYADGVMNRLPRRARVKQLEHWAVAFEAFKRGARWRHHAR